MNVPALNSSSGEGRFSDDVTEARHDLKAECRIYKRSLLSAFESFPPELRPQATKKLLGHCQARPPMRILNNICSSEFIHSPKYLYFKFIFIYSEIISQPSNYTAHNNPKSRISRLDWHVYLFYQWGFLRVRFEPATFQLEVINLTTEPSSPDQL